MTRIDGHGPKPKIQFIDEWTPLKNALGGLRRALEINSDREVPEGVIKLIPLQVAEVADIVHYVPMLMDAYAELWELMEGVIKAREAQEASKGDLYVPDAAEMVANARRTQR